MDDQRQQIFQRVKSLLSAYQPPLAVKLDNEKRFELWSYGDFVVEGKKRKEIFFASAIIQKSYVGFYFMPVYTDVDIKQVFGDDLLRLLKGKSCFHLKQWDEALRRQIEEALKMGYQLYLQKGWIVEKKSHAG